MKLVLLQFNNYYNRIIRKLERKSDYEEQSERIQEIAMTNFSPNDSIRTSQVINTAVDVIENPFDYLLVCKDDDTIVSRWWILDATRTSLNQYQLSLLRDVIADNYYAVLDATSFIRKGTIKALTDMSLFNLENMTFNRVKFRETPLWDDTRVPWIVGYIPRDSFQTDSTITSEIEITETPDITVNGISTWEYLNKTYLFSAQKQTQLRVINRYLQNSVYYAYAGNTIRFSNTEDLPTVEQTDPVGNVSNLDSEFYNTYMYDYVPLQLNASGAKQNLLTNIMTDTYYDQLDTWFNNAYNAGTDESIISSLNNKIIYDSAADDYYRVTLEKETLIDQLDTLAPSLLSFLNNNLNTEKLISGGSTNNTWRFVYSGTRCHVAVNKLTKKIGTVINSDRAHLEDAPYDMFCIPYGEVKMWTSIEDLTSFTCEKDAAIHIAQAIAAQFGSNTVYDIQLLPYCPLRKIIYPGRLSEINLSKVRYNPIVIANTTTPVSALIWCDTSSFSFDILAGIMTMGRTPLERKIANETRMQRICSPNYNGIFEFNKEKNNGVDGFHVDCTYKPFNPYIHVAPIWNNGSLYGGNFDDARGLICGGDFSITQLTSQWADYQLQNKNFQAQFDRQIQNLEKRQSVEEIQSNINALVGTVSGVAGGAATGQMVGGGMSAAIGGTAGGIASGIGGLIDVNLSRQLREEEKSYAIDQYGYSMENIQAIPYSLSKIDAFNKNYKFFPFLEDYRCTEVEKRAFINKLTYDGMTVMRIDRIANFIADEPHFIQAQLVRLEGIPEDYHMINAIADELNKGVFI